MVYAIMIPLSVIGWFVNSNRYYYFLDSLEDLVEDCYPTGSTRAFLVVTAIGFGLAHVFGTNPGPVGEMSLYRGIGALAYTGVAAMILCGIVAAGTLNEYVEDTSYRPNDGMVGIWQIGLTLGIAGTGTGFGYFVVPALF
jgi:hypothetical protein